MGLPGKVDAELGPTWRACTGCNLYQYRRFVVLGRGTACPADILFIGLGPGKSENVLGLPFVGEAGWLLQTTINRALVIVHSEMRVGCIARGLTYYITNMVACRPCDSKYGPNRDPKSNEIAACAPRVIATHNMVKPGMVVLFGKLTQAQYGKMWPNTIGMNHPSYILRRGGVSSPDYTTYVRKMADAMRTTLFRGGGV